MTFPVTFLNLYADRYEFFLVFSHFPEFDGFAPEFDSVGTEVQIIRSGFGNAEIAHKARIIVHIHFEPAQAFAENL